MVRDRLSAAYPREEIDSSQHSTDYAAGELTRFTGVTGPGAVRPPNA